MQRYLLRRVVLFVPTLLIGSLLIFVIMRVIPGDVVLLIVGGEEEVQSLSQHDVDRIREELGLSDPLPVQYANWLWSMVNGEFGGRSLIDNESMAESIARRGPVTLQLALMTILIAWTVSIPLGVVAALYQNKWPDYLVRSLSIAGHAMPNFWLALVLIIALVLIFSWTPPIFYAHLWENPWDHMQKIIWPALILAWGFSSSLIRVTRSNMLESLRQDYVRTARSKGLPEKIVIVRHTLRNALMPVITLGGLELGALFSGSVILESIFGLPGLGQGIIGAASNRDYPVIQSLTMLLVVMMLSVNLLVDILYSFVDPRIRYS
jgi:peptide/nickel transport system permease protein